MAATRENIGVVGLGRMGANIARHLRDEGFAVVAVYDTDRPRATELASELGATACATLADVSAQADTILTVVTDDPAMDAIFAESGDSLLVGADGRLFINCATVTPAIHVTIEAAPNGPVPRASKPAWPAAFPRPATAHSTSCVPATPPRSSAPSRCSRP